MVIGFLKILIRHVAREKWLKIFIIIMQKNDFNSNLHESPFT